MENHEENITSLYKFIVCPNHKEQNYFLLQHPEELIAEELEKVQRMVIRMVKGVNIFHLGEIK